MGTQLYHHHSNFAHMLTRGATTVREISLFRCVRYWFIRRRHYNTVRRQHYNTTANQAEKCGRGTVPTMGHTCHTTKYVNNIPVAWEKHSAESPPKSLVVAVKQTQIIRRERGSANYWRGSLIKTLPEVARISRLISSSVETGQVRQSIVGVKVPPLL